ncbi:AhpC/TSA family protein [Chitinophaga sedimenti]|uniref:TlpA disulfide reductase family protein n=1 Tax=Chitinophaga sedimenti TaxID=2033606 RepID=UPI002005B68E|nr:TlpA disulfide reductase family protein [Chitinophaga sedimenti]MCK7560067.1 AhpC/TSA family protein [Chitinophaga sedimenti]
MKNLFLSVAILTSALAAHAQQTISGTFKGANSKTLYLFDDTSDGPRDSVIVKDEKFRFTLKPGGDAEIYALLLQDADNFMFVVPRKDASLEFTLDTGHFPLANDMKVNDDTKYMQLYQRTFTSFSKQAAKLNEEAQHIGPNDQAAYEAFKKKADTYNKGVVAAGRDFITQYPDKLASLWMLGNELAKRWKFRSWRPCTTLTPAVRKSKHAARISGYLASQKAQALNVAADDFTQNDTKGKPVKLSSFRGKYVLVDFWASWCGPCRQENPNVVAAYNKYKDKNFTVLGVSLDEDRNDWLKAIAADKLQWTQVSDLRGWQNKVAQQYGVRSIPANFLVDPQGKIVARNLRGMDLDAKLDELLQ